MNESADVASPPGPVRRVSHSDRPTTIRYRALAWLTAAMALAYLCRHALGVAESTIRNDLELTLKQSGFLQGAFFWSYAVLQVPGGWFAERRGTRIALSIFAMVWSIAMIEMGVAPVFWLLVAAQIVMGAAQAGMLPAAYNSVGFWMPVSQRALSCGILGTGMQIGAIAASALAARWIGPLGWRWIYLLFAAPGILWAIGFLIRFRDRPSQVAAVNSSELSLILAARESTGATPDVEIDESNELLSLARSPVMWWLCGQQIFRAAGGTFFLSWLPTFLQETRGAAVETSGYMQSAILVVILPAAVLSGVVTDWIWKRTGNLRLSRSGVAAVTLSICALSLLGAWSAQNSSLVLLLLAMSGFFGAQSGSCAFAAAIDVAGPRVPQVVAIMNMSGNFAAAGCPLLVAALVEPTANWNLLLPMFAAIYLASAVCWLFVNPQRHLK